MNEKIIIIQDLLDTKRRKERELLFYNEELRKLQERMHYLRLEINLTTNIIHLIETERMLDMKEWMEKRNDSN